MHKVEPKPNLMAAIGCQNLTEYFEFLDDLRESGTANMFGAGRELREEYPGMTKQESQIVLSVWMETFSDIPAEDRADAAIGKASA
jgi:hypothetical protein